MSEAKVDHLGEAVELSYSATLADVPDTSAIRFATNAIAEVLIAIAEELRKINERAEAEAERKDWFADHDKSEQRWPVYDDDPNEAR